MVLTLLNSVQRAPVFIYHCIGKGRSCLFGALTVLELIRLHYFYLESTIVPEPGGSTHAALVPFWTGIATGGSLPVQHVTAE